VSVDKSVEEKLRRKERLYEKKQLMKKKRSEEYEVLEEVFDRPTLMTLYRLLNQGKIKSIGGVVKSGKEARVYHGTDPEGRSLAIKIYLTVSAGFRKGRLIYIRGDPRFKSIKQDTRSFVYSWTQKEYKNLQMAYESGIRVPKPIQVKKNILVMEFIGDGNTPAPLLREAFPKDPEDMYLRLLKCVKDLYRKAGLVHGDLSEYNVMSWKERPIIFDMSQAVLLEHPMAEQFLRRDIINLNHFFRKLGVNVKDAEEIYKWVTQDG
jgi:RIO kinase 1